MTDDIVIRLRNWHDQRDSWQTLTEAANEIELLRNHLSSCQSDLNYWYERCTQAEACADIMHKQINRKWWKR
jgi:hypothetical protein